MLGPWGPWGPWVACRGLPWLVLCRGMSSDGDLVPTADLVPGVGGSRDWAISTEGKRRKPCSVFASLSLCIFASIFASCHSPKFLNESTVPHLPLVVTPQSQANFQATIRWGCCEASTCVHMSTRTNMQIHAAPAHVVGGLGPTGVFFRSNHDGSDPASRLGRHRAGIDRVTQRTGWHWAPGWTGPPGRVGAVGGIGPPRRWCTGLRFGVVWTHMEMLCHSGRDVE